MMEENELTNRRGFLIKLSIGLGAAGATVVGVPFVASLLEPLLRTKKDEWRKIGKLTDFQIGKTQLVTFLNAAPAPWAGPTDKSAAWVRRDEEDKFTAFSANCTHLGCPVRWEERAELFMCPCHGGVFYKDGKPAAGPPPKALVKYAVRTNGADLEIRTAPVPITQMTTDEART